MLVKIHRSYRNVVAVCDKELLGKTFEEGKRQLAIKEPFFKGDEMKEEEAVKVLSSQRREDATFNIVGKKSLAAAVKAGIAKEGRFDSIQGIPFIIILL